ncbi:MAG TPA: helix-turn-helix domain-containing protein [Dermatophilaceae bacterium]|nr:helix-turn-helix domain-containing protein [Dermatophilaceae bacterium]
MSESGLSRKRTETRSRLLSAAMEVFSERGIMASSVEQICERAGYTRGAFYSNFESKDELCIALLEGEKQYYANAVGRGAAATAAHFQAHPEDRDQPPFELVGLALDLIFAAFVEGTDDQDAAWSTVSLLYAELGLYAAREPSVREAYATYTAHWMAPFELLVEQIFARCGLRLTVSPAEAVVVLSSIFEVASRKALIVDSPEGMVQEMKADMLLAARIISRPVDSGVDGG